jgi:hypothetical protein
VAGNDALREGLLIDALHHYTEALRHVSGSHLALSNRAYVRCLLGRHVTIGWGWFVYVRCLLGRHVTIG